MQEYKELYASKRFKLYGSYEENGAFVFRVELDRYLISGFNFGYAGAGLFYFMPNKEEELCQKLQKLYDTLKGECLIQDCEFGNVIRLYFSGRQLRIEGKFYEGEQFLKFSGDVDQTIIPHIISLLRTK